MSILEAQTIDTTQLLLRAYEIGEMVTNSIEVAEYLYWKEIVEQDREIQQAARRFNEKKRTFEECRRFGHFHPDYHAALEQVEQMQKELDAFAAVRHFKQAENRLDDLLYSVSETIAYAVSDKVKVPSNDPLPKKGGCGSGGACSGNCG